MVTTDFVVFHYLAMVESFSAWSTNIEDQVIYRVDLERSQH